MLSNKGGHYDRLSFYNLKFLENSDIIYIESERKEMIDMDIEICKNSSVAVQVKFWDGEIGVPVYGRSAPCMWMLRRNL